MPKPNHPTPFNRKLRVMAVSVTSVHHRRTNAEIATTVCGTNTGVADADVDAVSDGDADTDCDRDGDTADRDGDDERDADADRDTLGDGDAAVNVNTIELCTRLGPWYWIVSLDTQAARTRVSSDSCAHGSLSRHTRTSLGATPQ
jgi:hypothetical protein